MATGKSAPVFVLFKGQVQKPKTLQFPLKRHNPPLGKTYSETCFWLTDIRTFKARKLSMINVCVFHPAGLEAGLRLATS